MAGLVFTATAANASTTAVTATMLQLIAATNVRIRLREITVMFQGTSSTAAMYDVQLVRQTDNGGGGTSVTLVKTDNDAGETLQSSAEKAPFLTTDPTSTDVIKEWAIHPQTGLIYPFVSRDIYVNGGDRVGVKIVSPEADIKVTVQIEAEE